MSREIIFGEISGFQEGHWFSGRKEMMPSSFHRKWGSGIDGDKNLGAAAICLSGGYEDDLDEGDIIIYTGRGGQDSKTRRQVDNQSLDDHDNRSIFISYTNGNPVRVIRGAGHKSTYSPIEGYTYSGLYKVTDFWQEVGRAGFNMVKFRLEKIEISTNDTVVAPEEVIDSTFSPTMRKQRTSSSVVRNTKIVARIKELYDDRCQICNFKTPTCDPRVHYSEAAHIVPLGEPHNGRDSIDNLLCLCPNHHKMLDFGAFGINDDLKLIGKLTGELTVHKNHKIHPDAFRHHRNRFNLK